MYKAKFNFETIQVYSACSNLGRVQEQYAVVFI